MLFSKEIKGFAKTLFMSYKILVKYAMTFLKGPPNTFFLNALKQTTEDFLKLIFLFESTILPVINGK